jgi:predicted pyridoxine 5'-phosphate oxidase superfamily flavin-nucleotide-binding protein
MAPGPQPRGGRVSQRAPIASGATPPGGVSGLFHEGERAVQRRAGAERMAAQVGRNIVSFVPAEFGAFLSRQPFVVVASQDQDGRGWASLIAGRAGFARALDDRQILLAGLPAPADPLEGALERPPAGIGVLAIEFSTRQRIRLNGVAQPTGEGILLTVAGRSATAPSSSSAGFRLGSSRDRPRRRIARARRSMPARRRS